MNKDESCPGITIKTPINLYENALTSIGGRSVYNLSRLSVASSHVLASSDQEFVT